MPSSAAEFFWGRVSSLRVLQEFSRTTGNLLPAAR